MNQLVWIGAAVTAILLYGCGVTLETTRVTPSDAPMKTGQLAPTQVKGEGTDDFFD